MPNALSPDGGLAREIFARSGAGCDILWIAAPGDENRIAHEIHEAARLLTSRSSRPLTYGVRFWDGARGLSPAAGSQEGWKACGPEEVLTIAQSTPTPTTPPDLFVLWDGHNIVNRPEHSLLRRRLADAARYHWINRAAAPAADGHAAVPSCRRMLILVGPTPTPHPDVREYVSVLEVPYPSADDIQTHVVDPAFLPLAERLPTTPADRERLAAGLRGMTLGEAEKALSLAIVKSAGELARIPAVVAEEKARALKKVDGLTYVPHADLPRIEDLAGFDGLVGYLRGRRRTYGRHASRHGLEKPRGIVLLGPPGTAKTQAGMAGARVLGLDFVSLDIGAMFTGIVGGSEERIRRVLAAVEAMRTAWLMIDEIEKALGNAHKTQMNDGGVGSRLLSYLLSWLANRDMRAADGNHTFVAVTMNRTAGMPPELLRAGRFDRIFYTKLPDLDARVGILKLHLRRRGIDPDRYGDAALRLLLEKATDGFVGSELEQVVVNAQVAAYGEAVGGFPEDAPEDALPAGEALWPTLDHLSAAVREVTPLYDVDRDGIDEILRYCESSGVYPVDGRRAPRPQRGGPAKGRRNVNVEAN
jgi:hypothetical protein